MKNKLNKDYKNILEQETILKQRNMIIDNTNILKEINYSHIIYKYGSFFVDKYDGEIPIYKNNTKISNLYNLFKLNIGISSILFEAIGVFEHKFKRAVATSLAKIDPLFHVKINNKDVDQFTKIQRSNIKKYDKIYLLDGNIPIWLFVDHLTLNQLLVLAKSSKKLNIILNEISESKKITIKHINIIKKYRNLTHHYNPLITISQNNTNVKTLLEILRDIDEVSFKKIINYFKNFKSDIGIQKEELAKILKLEKLLGNREENEITINICGYKKIKTAKF